MTTKSEKLQKVLSRAGYGSRRQIEEWIMLGFVEVNDHIATTGERVIPTDKIYLRGKFCDRACESVQTRVLLYHKPEGVVTTRSDPEGRPTVFDALPPIREGRWINVGRLDFNTSGLLIFTNDGELVHQITHPSAQVEREYAVRVMGRVAPNVIERLLKGVELEDGVARFESIIDMGGEGLNHWFRVIVSEGRNRVVRRLWESQNLKINRLKRLRFGPISLPKSLARGAWLELEREQVRRLWEFCRGKSHVSN